MDTSDNQNLTGSAGRDHDSAAAAAAAAPFAPPAALDELARPPPTGRFYRSSSSSSSSSDDSSDSSDSSDDDSWNLDSCKSQPWLQNGYEIEEEHDEEEEHSFASTATVPRRRTLSQLCDGVVDQLARMPVDWKQVLADFKSANKKFSAAAPSSTVTAKARWKRGGSFYPVRSWTLKEEGSSISFDIAFEDGDTRDSVPPEEVQLPAVDTSFWGMVARLRKSLLDVDDGSQRSKAQRKKKTKATEQPQRHQLSTANAKAVIRLRSATDARWKDPGAKTWQARLLTMGMTDANKTVPPQSAERTRQKEKHKKKRRKEKTEKQREDGGEASGATVVQNPRSAHQDFGDLLALDFEEDIAVAKGRMFLRLQQRTRRKRWTLVHGFAPDVDLECVRKRLANMSQCGASIVEKPGRAKGAVTRCIQLQGDHTASVTQFLLSEGFVDRLDQITTKGF